MTALTFFNISSKLTNLKLSVCSLVTYYEGETSQVLFKSIWQCILVVFVFTFLQQVLL